QLTAISIDCWENHFTTLFQDSTKEPPTTPTPFPISPAAYNSTSLHATFTPEEVHVAIMKAANKKAPGIDRITHEHLKLSLPVLNIYWTRLFNVCLSTASIPTQWKTSLVTILYKGKGDIANPNSYRGISLLCCAFKVLTKIITWRLEAATFGSIPEEQHGFQKGRSVDTAIKILLQDARNRLSQPRSPLYIVYVDFTKAFDSIPRKFILQRLREIGIDDGPML